MPDRDVFIGFGQPVRGREERAVDVFNDFVGLFGRMAAAGRIEDMDVTLLDFHGGDLGGFFMVHGSAEQCSALMMDEEFRGACVDASLIVGHRGRRGDDALLGGDPQGRRRRARPRGRLSQRAALMAPAARSRSP